MADYMTGPEVFGSPPSYVIRVIDWAFIPIDDENRDYRTFLAWQEAGNTVDPYDPNAQPKTPRGEAYNAPLPLIGV